MIDDTLLVTLFCQVDDFCKMFEKEQEQNLLASYKRERKRRMTLSDLMTIEIFFHRSDYKDFKSYYYKFVEPYLKPYFSNLVCYSRFIQEKQRMLIPLTIFMYLNRGKETGIYFVDSSAMEVCHIKREHQHKVFKKLAQKGKTTTGWFFGFKLHIVLNHLGEIMAVKITGAKTDDRSPVADLMKKLQGWLVGDKGYISEALTQKLKKQSIELITKTKKNMKKRVLNPVKKKLLKARGIIETAIGLMKYDSMIEHTRHRSPINAMVNLFSGLCAYQLRERKPTIKMGVFLENSMLLN
jgi:hypothetical protein